MSSEPRKGPRAITLRDVAERLSLSRATVSRALNGTADAFISDATRVRVRETAAEMGYRPNHTARSLATGKTGLIALWLWSMRKPGSYHAAVGQAMHEAALRRHLQMLLDPIVPSDDPANRFRSFDRWNVDGIVAHEAAPAIARLLKGGVAPPVPIVATGAYSWVDGVDQVRVDLLPGARDAVRHLVEGGRKKIVYVTDDLPDRDDDLRYIAFTEVLSEAGIEPRFLDSAATRVAARQRIKEYVEELGVPDALFCHTDDIAIGAYRGLCDLGVRVPSEVAIVGFDGIEDCEYLEVPLTSVVQPLEKMCDLAIEMLITRMEKPDRPLQKEVLRAELVVRESSLPQKTKFI